MGQHGYGNRNSVSATPVSPPVQQSKYEALLAHVQEKYGINDEGNIVQGYPNLQITIKGLWLLPAKELTMLFLILHDKHRTQAAWLWANYPDKIDFQKLPKREPVFQSSQMSSVPNVLVKEGKTLNFKEIFLGQESTFKLAFVQAVTADKKDNFLLSVIKLMNTEFGGNASAEHTEQNQFIIQLENNFNITYEKINSTKLCTRSYWNSNLPLSYRKIVDHAQQ